MAAGYFASRDVMNNPIQYRPASTNTPDGDSISLLAITNTLLRNWVVIVVLPVLLALATGLWSYSRDRTYAATVTFAFQPSEGESPRGGATALAQQFGVNLGSASPGRSTQFYVELLRSRTLLRQAVESEYQLTTPDGDLWRGTLVDFWRIEAVEGELPPWRQAAETLSRAINTSVSRETQLVEVRVSSLNPVLAERIAERLVELLNDFNVELRRSHSAQEASFIGERVAEARQELLAAERVLQNFLRQNREFRNSPELVFEHDRLQRDVIMRQEVFTSLLRSQEQTRVDAVRNVTLFNVIDRPAGTAEPQPRRTIQFVLLGFMGGLVLAVFLGFMRDFARRSKEREDPDHQEFQFLVRKMADDLRHPTRWIRRRPTRASHRHDSTEASSGTAIRDRDVRP
jgi:uncharacterized protein involved in exopolysaccharide biosynthesis